MTSSIESLTQLPDQHLQAAQNHAARKAMVLSGIEYDGQTVEGQPDPPVPASIRLAKLGRISQRGLNILYDAGIVTD